MHAILSFFIWCFSGLIISLSKLRRTASRNSVVGHPHVARNVLPMIHIKCQWLHIFLYKIRDTYYGSEVVLRRFPLERTITLHVVHVPPPHARHELILSSINMLNFILRVYSRRSRQHSADRSPEALNLKQELLDRSSSKSACVASLSMMFFHKYFDVPALTRLFICALRFVPVSFVTHLHIDLVCSLPLCSCLVYLASPYRQRKCTL
jgi:hypothetical protein